MSKKEQIPAAQESGEKKLDQFVRWEDFVDEKLWPITENAIQKAQKIRDQINKKFESGDLAESDIDSFGKKFDKAKKEFKSDLEKLSKVIQTGYGPIAHIVLDMIYHDAPKMFDDIRKNLKSEWSLDKVLENYGINKQGFIKRVGEAIAISQESYNNEKQIIAESGDSLNIDLQAIMKQPFENALDRLPKKKKKKYNWKIEIDKDIKNEIPPYEKILDEVLREFIINAVEAMKQGGNIIIIMRISKEEGCFVVELEDNGPGISPENLKHIFDKDFTTKKTEGGRGLFFNKEAIEKIMNGSLEVESEVGKGTKFIIKIPT